VFSAPPGLFTISICPPDFAPWFASARVTTQVNSGRVLRKLTLR